MPYRKPSRARLRTLCAEVHSDDGSDPRVFFRKNSSTDKPDHRARRLCRQVFEVLDNQLADHSSDELNDLAIVSVDPAPDSTHLLVTVTPRPSGIPADPSTILASLSRVSGQFRAEVAAAITRRRAPLLSFRVVEIRSPSSTRLD